MQNGSLSWWTNGTEGSSSNEIQGLIAHQTKIDQRSFNAFISASNNVSEISTYIDDIWNSALARYFVSDTYSFGLSSNISLIFGGGVNPLYFTVITRGKEPGIYYTPTLNLSVGDGGEANAGFAFSKGWYTGDPRKIQSSFLQGHSLGVSGGLGFIADGSLGISYSPVERRDSFGKHGGFINVGGQFGAGVEVSPATIVNAQINYQYTPMVIPLIKF